MVSSPLCMLHASSNSPSLITLPIFGTSNESHHYAIFSSLLSRPPSRPKYSQYDLQFNTFSRCSWLNPLTPNDPYSGRTAPLTSKRCILYIYSTNIGTEYFKHGIYSPFLSLQNAVCFIILIYLVPVLFTL